MPDIDRPVRVDVHLHDEHVLQNMAELQKKYELLDQRYVKLYGLFQEVLNRLSDLKDR